MGDDAGHGAGPQSPPPSKAAVLAIATSPITTSVSPPPLSPPPLSPPPLSLPRVLASPPMTPPISPLTASQSTCGAPEPDEAASEYQRKRAERMFSCESMREDLDRDLRITGVTKKGSSWQYHIEVLDPRVRMPSFTDPGNLSTQLSLSPRTTHTNPTAEASSAVQSDDASYAALPPTVRYSVMRRYNDFRQLYMYIADTYGAEALAALPKFPDGGLLSYLRGDDPRLLQFRKEQLERFLRALDEHPQLRWCRGVTHFLRPDIRELTTIGGLFQSHADDAADAPFALRDTSGFAAPLRLPTSSSSGYVSLSLVKSPEIRFGKHVSDGRGDRKRRRVPFPLWGSSSSNGGADAGASAGASASDPEPPSAAVIATVNTRSSGAKRESLTEDEDDDDAPNDKEQQNGDEESNRAHPMPVPPAAAPPTRLMKLLSLETPQ